MGESIIDVVSFIKYLSWILTVGTAFIGSWFFEFTNTDKETGKRSLTRWGKRGIVFASLALILAFMSTVWGDYDSARKQKVAAQKTTIEKSKAEDEKLKAAEALSRVEKLQLDAQQLLKIIADNMKNIPLPEQISVIQRVSSLRSVNDYKTLYPDLYNRILSATSFEQAAPPMKEALGRQVESHISQEQRCKDIKLNKWPDIPDRGGAIALCDNMAQHIYTNLH